MCQMRIVIERDGKEGLLIENPSSLTATEEGLTINALFEEPIFLPRARVAAIDFMKGKVVLTQTEEGN